MTLITNGNVLKNMYSLKDILLLVASCYPHYIIQTFKYSKDYYQIMKRREAGNVLRPYHWIAIFIFAAGWLTLALHFVLISTIYLSGGIITSLDLLNKYTKKLNRRNKKWQ